jgi:Domain of unknown function (DUF4431)
VTNLREIVLAGLIATILGGCAAQPLYYEHPQYAFRGTLAAESYAGSPNYGESPDTDSIETAYILSLDRPVAVRPHPGDEANLDRLDGVRHVQLVGVLRGALSTAVGRRVTIRGTLSEAISSHHRTDALLNVDSITSETGAQIPFRLTE